MLPEKCSFLIFTGSIAANLLFVSGLLFASPYDETRINGDLNASNKLDHITLTWSDDPATTMTLTWRTDSSVKACQVEYTSFQDDPGKKSGVPDIRPRSFHTTATDNVSGTMHLFTTTLTGLAPGTKYTYKIGCEENQWSHPHVFTTESDYEKSTNTFRFLLFGDSQSGDLQIPDYKQWHTTINNAFNANKEARFFINVGDLVEGQIYQHWNNWFNAVEGIIDTIPAMVVAGNHETFNGERGKSTKPEYLIAQFNVFANGPPNLRGQVYSYNYGKCHFAVLDSQAYEESRNAAGFPDQGKEIALLKEQAEWLDKDLANNMNAEFIFVLFHKAPYHNKGNRANTLVKDTFGPIFDKHHVDVVFNGHDHASARTYPIFHNQLQQHPAQGTVYYTTGRSGEKYYTDLIKKVWNAQFFDPRDQPDYQTVELAGRKVTIKCFKQDGRLVDTYIIDKDHPENNTSNKEPLPPKIHPLSHMDRN
jgi:acid phosphatase type 7